MSSKKIRLYKLIEFTSVEGPGIRTCIWVQGCSIKCNGCANSKTWSDKEEKKILIDELASYIIEYKNKIEGVTFSGGEPFEQSSSLSKLGKIIRENNLTIITFTGYTYEQILSSNNKDWNELLNVTDLLIDGPYRIDLHDLSRPWVGSSNQKYRFLTNRYRYLENKLSCVGNKFEFHMKSDGKLFINGMGNFEKLKLFLDDLKI